MVDEETFQTRVNLDEPLTLTEAEKIMTIRPSERQALSELQVTMLRAEVVGYDGTVKRDQIAAAQDLVARGLMDERDLGSDEQQYTYIQCRITEAGRRALARFDLIERGAIALFHHLFRKAQETRPDYVWNAKDVIGMDLVRAGLRAEARAVLFATGALDD